MGRHYHDRLGAEARLQKQPPPSSQGHTRCYECGVEITDENKSDHSPYFCKPCDIERMDRISNQFDDIMAKFEGE